MEEKTLNISLDEYNTICACLLRRLTEICNLLEQPKPMCFESKEQLKSESESIMHLYNKVTGKEYLK